MQLLLSLTIIRGFRETLDLHSFSSSHLQCTRKKKRCHFKTREFSPVRAARQNIEVRNWHEKMASGVAAADATSELDLHESELNPKPGAPKLQKMVVSDHLMEFLANVIHANLEEWFMVLVDNKRGKIKAC